MRPRRKERGDLVGGQGNGSGVLRRDRALEKSRAYPVHLKERQGSCPAIQCLGQHVFGDLQGLARRKLGIFGHIPRKQWEDVLHRQSATTASRGD
jgi:hypothetical protein